LYLAAKTLKSREGRRHRYQAVYKTRKGRQPTDNLKHSSSQNGFTIYIVYVDIWLVRRLDSLAVAPMPKNDTLILVKIAEPINY